MKSILSLITILALSFLFTSAISIIEAPQDPPKKEKGEKHIKMIKIDKDGKKVKIDTVIAANQFLEWHADSIEKLHDLSKMLNEDFDFDLDIDFELDETGNAFIFKGPNASKPAIYSTKIFKGDSAEHVLMKILADSISADLMHWQSKNEHETYFGSPGAANHRVIQFNKQKRTNVIDLSDPGIISFEKKELKNGKEKIVIVRKKPTQEEDQMHEALIKRYNGTDPVILHKHHPKICDEVTVIKKENGTVAITENGKTWIVTEGDENAQIIEKDGKKIIIKKINDGKEIKVDVEVEEK